MKSQVFNVNNIEWTESHDNVSKTKVIAGTEICPHAVIRLFRLESKETFQKHLHNFVQIMFFVYGGDGEVTLDDEIIEIKKGLTIIIQPEQEHSIKNNSDSHLEFLVFEEQKGPNPSYLPFIDF